MHPSRIRHMGDQYSSAMCALYFENCKLQSDALNVSNAVVLEFLKINKTIHLVFED